MAYTLGQLIEDNIVHGCQMMSHVSEWENREVRFAMVHELPMEGFVLEGEIVITSAVGGWEEKSEEDVISRILDEVNGSGACAILFSLFSTKHVSDVIIKKSEQINIPIFTIPWESTFTEVQGNINDAIQNSRMEMYRRLQDRLFEAYFKSSDLEPVVDIVSEAVDAPVALFDRQERCLVKTSDYTDGPWKIIIGSLKRPYGTLAIQREAPRGNLKELVHQYIGYPLALWFNEIQVEEFTTVRLRSDIAITLARGTYRDFDEVVKQAKMLDLDLSKSYYSAVVSVFGKTERLRRKILESVVEIMAIAQEEGKRRNRHVIIGNMRNRFIIFLEKPHATTNIEKDPIVEAIQENIKKMLPYVWCLWGFSDTGYEETDFVKLYNEASLAMKYCDRQIESDQRVYYHEARILRIMSAITADNSISNDADKIMSGIIDYDNGNGSMELMKTLTEYIKNGYNASKTSRCLHIHRQSLLARLEKIEMLTGLSLDNKEDLFVLEVYSRIYKSY